jgi:hypothetical protein
MGEVVIGVDAHKRSHTLVAVDEIGRKIAERTVGTTSEYHLQVLENGPVNGRWCGSLWRTVATSSADWRRICCEQARRWSGCRPN